MSDADDRCASGVARQLLGDLVARYGISDWARDAGDVSALRGDLVARVLLASGPVGDVAQVVSFE